MAKFDIMTVLGFKRHKVETNQKIFDEVDARVNVHTLYKLSLIHI